MPTVLDYRSRRIQRLPDRLRGRIATRVAVASSIFIVWLSHQARMAMVTNSAEWCGNARMNAENNLIMLGLLLFVPAIATCQSWQAKVGFRVSRTSFAVAALGWLFYVVSANVGLTL